LDRLSKYQDEQLRFLSDFRVLIKVLFIRQLVLL
jgi:hypothetical protein